MEISILAALICCCVGLQSSVSLALARALVTVVVSIVAFNVLLIYPGRQVLMGFVSQLMTMV
jgi:hypothetical protein